MSEGPIITGRLRLKDETGTTLSSIKGKIGSAFSLIAKGTVIAGAAATAGMGLSIKAAAEFEEALTRIIAAAGKTGKEADDLKTALSEAAKTAGPEFGISATAAVGALEALVKAGLEGEDAIMALQGSLQLAALEGLDTAEASNMLVAAMTMFGLEAEDATHVIDLFSAASDAGIDAAGGYAQGLSNVGATANAMGLSMEETMAALVQLDNTFGSAQAGGTFLNRMLLDMTAKAEDAGLELYNVDGSMRTLDEIMGQVRGVLQGFGDDQQAVNEWMGKFDTRAQKAILGLSGYGESISDTKEDLGEMQTAQDKVNVILDTFAGRTKTATARIQVMSVSLGERLMPYALGVLTVFEDMLPVISDLLEDFAAFATKIFGVASALAEGDWGAAFKIIEEVYSNISSKFVEWFNEINWNEVWANAKAFLGTIYDKFMDWAGDIGTAFFNWFGSIDWTTVFSKLSDWMDDFYDWLFNQAATDIGTAFSNWVGSVDWAAVFQSLGSFAINLPLWIVEQVGKATATLGALLATYVSKTDWGEVFSAIGNGVINTLKGAAKALLRWMPNWLKKLLGIKKITTPSAPKPPSPPRPTLPPPGLLDGDIYVEAPTIEPTPAPPEPEPEPIPEIPEDYLDAIQRMEEAKLIPIITLPTYEEEDIYGYGGGDRVWRQRGFEGWVDRPTLFGAGEAGAEFVSIIPRGARGAAGRVFNFTFNVQGKLDEDVGRKISRNIMREIRRYG